jgi:Flp pilus assembly protein TadG
MKNQYEGHEAVDHSLTDIYGGSPVKTSLVSRVRGLLSSDSEGGAIVEMAVTLPLVMLILTGIVSFSFVLYQKLQLAEAVSNAGHYLATARGDTDPCANAIAAVQNAAPGLSPSQLTISLTQDGTALPTSCPTTPSSSTLVHGSTASVSATYPTALSVYGSSYSSFNLVSQISEVVQ